MSDIWLISQTDTIEPVIGMYVIHRQVYDEQMDMFTNGQYKTVSLYLCRDGVVRQQCLEGLEAGESLTREQVLASTAVGYFPTLKECEELLKRKKFRYDILSMASWTPEETA